jgi:hypothetical protein
MALELEPESARAGLQVLARGYSRESESVTVVYLFGEQCFEVRISAGPVYYSFRSRRAALSFAAELCESQS